MIRNLFFSGGTSAYAQRFDSKFPRFTDPAGVVLHQMPDAMLALVATAVRVTYQLRHYTNMKYQLYAAIREWRTGIHQPTDFSADTYMDVYDGHVNTLEHLCDERPRAYHVMMGELYDLARCVSWMRYHDHS